MRELATENDMTYFELLDVAKDAVLQIEYNDGDATYEDFSHEVQFELLVARTILALEDEELNNLYVKWTGEVSPLAIECKLVS